MKVAIVILNRNRALDTLACLGSIAALDSNYYVIVVDNGSTDDSVPLISASYPNAVILESGENLGYAGGNNLGIEYALDDGCDCVWLLNDDVTVAPDSLSALVSAALAEPEAGFFGPKVYIHKDPRRILSAGILLRDGCWPQHRGMGEIDEGQFDAVAEVDCLSGCALLVSRRVIETVGLLDKDYFAYHEEIDWCYRGQQAGFKALFVPQARVWHPDTRSRDVDSPLVTYYMSRNYLLFLAKYHLGTATILRSLATYLLRVVNWSLRPKWRHKRHQRDALLRAILDFGRGRFGRAKWLE